jgi:hypothetical protein
MTINKVRKVEKVDCTCQYHPGFPRIYGNIAAINPKCPFHGELDMREFAKRICGFYGDDEHADPMEPGIDADPGL